MHVKKGDKVKVLAGKDRGKEGIITRAIPKDDRVVVAGINMLKRHERSKQQGKKGSIIERPNPVHVSNVKKVG
ncbi:MAG: 50S ribosomal protein L24 [Candidatus Vogelbacteria bacterium CG10_big_fil_rev_8_21_14_0_10_45_14]|uniref:Large ribosomal subunit protein uL24 n=1 Tax=Candidatus Vogelbacteria bacterium CG10_big_fil_rev_8_21_14_0_10_45_14 TaxID=1975042 RepID=A0A2H0RJH9_9BACT|nr:MAG: 50S ribosomal protein L24 [Candidatus Vogelbacteria bacterium CG10_big_fil_rev_8_21_14_0_10_45_14]